MKAVLISIHPKYCKLIADGKKTIEVRKTKPKLETPFKVYIYCTKGRNDIFWVDEEIKDIDGLPRGLKAYNSRFGNGSVIGEFVCDEITPLFSVATTSWDLLAGNVHEYAKGLVIMARLTEEEIHSYANGKNCYAWHISDLKIYDKPKELGEFSKPFVFDDRPMKDWCHNHCEICNEENCKYDLRITRPPQSWCYVEELEL